MIYSELTPISSEKTILGGRMLSIYFICHFSAPKVKHS